MPTKENVLNPFDFRKKISNQFQLGQLQILADNWGLDKADVCWKFITEGILNEKRKREQIEEFKKGR